MLLLTALAALLAAPTVPPPDTTHAAPPQLVRADEAPAAVPEAAPFNDHDAIEVDFSINPTSIYSGSRGFGLGGGVEIANLGWTGSLTELEALVAQHYFRGRGTVFSSDPYTSPLYGAVGVSYTTAGRRNFYGVGPYTDRDDDVDLSESHFEVQARLGYYPVPDGPILLQPVLGYRIDELRRPFKLDGGVPDATDVANLAAQNAASQANIANAVAQGSREGVEYGFDAAFDTRDDRRYASSGALVQLGLRRFDEVDGTGLGFFRYSGDVLGLLPIGARRVLFGGAHLEITRQDSNDSATDLSYYYLPILDNDYVTGFPGFRFVARDQFVVGGGVRFPLVAIGPVVLDGLVRADLAAAYDDIGDQFSFGVTFDSDPPPPGADVDLRPSAAVGLVLLDPERGRVRVSGLLGFSPEGFNVGEIRLNFDLRDFWNPGL